MIAFAKAYSYFQKMNTELLGLSIDSNSSHLAWVYDIFCRTGIHIPFPIIADRNGEIARKYGMISSDVSNTQTVRNVFIIDNNGIVRTIMIYPLNVGRFIPEILRTVEALQMADNTKSSIPANWITGNPVINPPPRTYLQLQENLSENNNQFSWYLNFSQPEQQNLNNPQCNE